VRRAHEARHALPGAQRRLLVRRLVREPRHASAAHGGVQGSVVGDGTGTNPSYQWFRSSAGGLTANILFATTLSPTIEFPDPGTYRVLLRVSTDGPGGVRQSVDTATKNVFVSAATFTQFFDQAVVASACTSCHSGVAPPSGLDWSGPAASARAPRERHLGQ
jgi:hypothetical protein